MSFSSRIKEEIISKGVPSNAERKAFLSGFIRATGTIISVDNEYGFEFSSENAKVVEFVLYLMRTCFSYEPKTPPTVARERITLECVGESAVKMLTDLEIIENTEGALSVNLELNKELLKTPNNKKAFIKGVFVGGGNATLPAKITENKMTSTGYHLEFVFSAYEPALEFSSFLANEGIFTKLTERKDGYIIYVKSSEDIKDFLAYIGAPKSVLEITELMVEKEITASANRRTNCDLANVNKQMEAAEKIINAINGIEETFGLDVLPTALKETALKRKEFPDETLQELADRLNVTKSCLNHRLRKILEIEKNLFN